VNAPAKPQLSRRALSPGKQLEKLESLREAFGVRAADEKLELLADLEHQSLSRSSDVERLHEMLCFMRAWPDGPKILAAVNRLLRNFDAREDLQRFAGKLGDTGIAGTDIRFRFYFVTARWLADRWPDALQIDWEQFDAKDQLASQLRCFTLFAERAALEQFEYDVQEWIEQMRGDGETDAVFLINRYAALQASDSLRESLFDALDPAFHLSPSETTPSRTREYQRPEVIQYQKRRLNRKGIDLRQAANMRLRIENVSGRAATRFVDLAKGAMVSRQRDLDAIAYANADDIVRVHCRQGMQIVLLGMLPESRYLLESEYAYLMLRNGAVVGYGTGTGLFGTCQIAFNLFPTYRGVATTELYGCVLAVFRQLFNADTFSVDSYQIGADNEEAIESGAWWFYARMGFRPRDSGALKLARNELKKGQKRGYRTGRGTLRRLAQHALFLSLGKNRTDVLGTICTDTVSLGVMEYLSRRFGSRREAGEKQCAQDLASALGVDSVESWSADEQLMWHRLSPVVAAMGGVGNWPKADRDALIAVIRAKGGAHEAEYVRLFDAHKRLRQAVARFAKKVANG
jgi:hypothetical protein